jgi:hypothetical protein
LIFPEEFAAKLKFDHPVETERYLADHPADLVLGLSGTAAVAPRLPSGKPLALSDDPETLRQAVGQNLCDQHRAKQGKRSQVVVLYALPVGQTPTTGPSTSQPPTGPPGTGRLAPPRNPLITCTEAYDALVPSLIAPEKDRKQLDQRLRELGESLCPHDYRFPYERAILTSVYGRARHDEAFLPLAAAAERAIVNDDTAALLEAMLRDSRQAFQPLASHPEWQTLLRAIRGRNRGLLKDSLSGSIHISPHPAEAPSASPVPALRSPAEPSDPPLDAITAPCRPSPVFAVFVIASPDPIGVRVNQAEFGFSSQEQRFVWLKTFDNAFAEVIAFSRQHRCKLAVEVRVEIDRSAAQGALEAIRRVFIVEG